MKTDISTFSRLAVHIPLQGGRSIDQLVLRFKKTPRSNNYDSTRYKTNWGLNNTAAIFRPINSDGLLHFCESCKKKKKTYLKYVTWIAMLRIQGEIKVDKQVRLLLLLDLFFLFLALDRQQQ